MKTLGLKLLTVMLLLVHLISPVQAAMDIASMADETPASPCLQHEDHEAASSAQQGHAACCEQASQCNQAGCDHCQHCASMVMMVTTPAQHLFNYQIDHIESVVSPLKGVTTAFQQRPPISHS